MIAGGVALLSAFQPVYFVYAMTTLGPSISHFLMMGQEVDMVIALLGCLFIIAMLKASKILESSLTQHIRAKMESERLSYQLQAEMREHERAKEKQREQKKRFRDFAEASSDWLWETDADLRYTWFSENVEKVTGIPREWHYGKNRNDLIQNEQKNTPAWHAHLAQLAAREPFHQFEFYRIGPDVTHWIQANGIPVFDDAGEFQGYRGTGTDITARKSAEIALADSEERFRDFADWAADLFWETDAELCYTMISARIEELIGLAHDDMRAPL